MVETTNERDGASLTLRGGEPTYIDVTHQSDGRDKQSPQAHSTGLLVGELLGMSLAKLLEFEICLWNPVLGGLSIKHA